MNTMDSVGQRTEERQQIADDKKTMDSVGRRIQQRTEERQQIADDKKAKRQDKSSDMESADKFYDSFAKQKKNINECLQDTAPKSKNVLESVRQQIGLLQQYLNEASMYLPQFQLKKSQEAIDLLVEEHASMQNKLFPKKRFGFNSKPAVNSATVAVIDNIKNISDDAKISGLVDSNFFGFRNMSNCTLSMDATELKNRQLNLQNLGNCKIYALGNLQSLQIANLTNCTVHIGPTTRSAFIKNCKECVFQIACQQVRIHCTTDTHFFLHVTGSAIIEDCTAVKFSSYNLTYEAIEEHYIESGLSKDVNNWNKIEDFYWLNESEKSPNFTLVYN